MSFLSGWLGNRTSQSEHDADIEEELRQLHEVMNAGIYIVNDDIDTAEAVFSSDNSAFHKLGYGISSFLRAVLGFEQDMMNEAWKRLADAEATALEQKARAVRTKRSMSSGLYPPGTEYALCAAEAQIMGALVGVMNESLTEAIKGFYKLRKAFITLDGICKAESASLNGQRAETAQSVSTDGTGAPKMRTETTSLNQSNGRPSYEESPPILDDQHDNEDEFYDADDDNGKSGLNDSYNGKLDIAGSQTNGLAKYNEDFDVGEFSNPVDGFIFSGSNLFYGIILIVVSLIPPSFSRLLAIIGFRGDRTAGIQRLWRATQFNDIAGAMAALVYLTTGNIGSLMDILPLQGPHAYAKERCKALLAEMIQRFPDSTLWNLERGRNLARDRRMEDAILVSRQNQGKNKPLQQVQSLKIFEVGLHSMYLQRFEDCAQSFLTCKDLNSWSHGLYYYIAAVSHIELYRLYTSGGIAASDELQPSEAPIEQHYRKVDPDETKAEEHATKAEEYLNEIPSHIGKKKFFSRQLPFDVFVGRKLNKWKERAESRGVRLADAVGVSPVVEMTLFWSGFTRMRKEHLESSLKLVEWSANHEQWSTDDFDEHALYAILKGTILRNLGRFEEAQAILKRDVIECGHSWEEFKSGQRDNWVPPMARYEMAATIWKEWEATHSDIAWLGVDEMPKDIPETEKLRQCSSYLEEVRRWGSYDLNARMGLKITTGRDTIRRFGVQSGSQ